MKNVLLLFVLSALLLGAAGPKPPPVSISRISAAVYAQAEKRAATGKKAAEKITHPVRKKNGCLVIPTATGNKVFRDKVIANNEVGDVTYEYQGFSAALQQHCIQVQYYESSEWLIVEQNGNIIHLFSPPDYSPNRALILTGSQGLVYSMMPNGMQLFRKTNGKMTLLWELRPATWEPAEFFWVSDALIYLKQERCTPEGETYSPRRFTYAQLVIKKE
ncbi:hypothetical protein Q5H93_20515 [Hymenobacter sp. ASUV-10]|uniref:Ricin B lectin domain-containing protein n=1 Tax=Hymenobacter aranciens TaxID=3063996 RepID=A0ABT9BFV9_9BACT|nr:hypothetical protein [Hymenobacter sp. ASUV-10]MDO7877141.1 hypothetical protein [Hymenobacter sp. ASUV-10]